MHIGTCARRIRITRENTIDQLDSLPIMINKTLEGLLHIDLFAHNPALSNDGNVLINGYYSLIIRQYLKMNLEHIHIYYLVKFQCTKKIILSLTRASLTFSIFR